MRINLEQWITSVQEKPEHVRLRYVVGCAGVAMLLVVGVWSLSVSQGFRSLSNEAGTVTEGAQGLLPQASNFSLDSLLSGEKSLSEIKKEVSGETFFQQQLKNRDQPNFDEEGVVPKSDTTDAKEGATIDSNDFYPAR